MPPTRIIVLAIAVLCCLVATPVHSHHIVSQRPITVTSVGPPSLEALATEFFSLVTARADRDARSSANGVDEGTSSAGLTYLPLDPAGGEQALAAAVARTVDVSFSLRPLSADQLAASGDTQGYPIWGVTVVPVFNLPPIEASQLTLRGTALGRVFAGNITQWDDPELRVGESFNNFLSGINEPIQLIVPGRVANSTDAARSQTVFEFVRGLTSMSADFAATQAGGAGVAPGTGSLTPTWAAGAVVVDGRPSEVLDRIAATPYSLGFVLGVDLEEWRSAGGLSRDIGSMWLRNRASNRVSGLENNNLLSALRYAPVVGTDRTLEVDAMNLGEAQAWPLVGTVYAIVRQFTEGDCVKAEYLCELLHHMTFVEDPTDALVTAATTRDLAPLALAWTESAESAPINFDGDQAGNLDDIYSELDDYKCADLDVVLPCHGGGCAVADNEICGGHGQCTENGCACQAGWEGVACSDDIEETWLEENETALIVGVVVSVVVLAFLIVVFVWHRGREKRSNPSFEKTYLARATNLSSCCSSDAGTWWKSLTFQYVTGLAVIVIVLLVAFAVMVVTLDDVEETNELIIEIEQQRVLVSNVAFFVGQLSSPDAQERLSSLARLRTSARVLRRVSIDIVDRITESGLSSSVTDDMENIYLEAPSILFSRLITFVDGAESLVALAEVAPGADIRAVLDQQSQSSTFLFSQQRTSELGDDVQRVAGVALTARDDTQDDMTTAVMGAFIVIVVVVLLVGMFVLRPMTLLVYTSMETVRKKSETLAEANTALERHTKRLKRQARQLRVAKKKADRARRDALAANKIKSQFLANMSHELRTPLNAVIGYSEMLFEDADDIPGAEVFKPDLERIKTAGELLLSLVNDVLDLSKVEAGALVLFYENFDTSRLAFEVCSTMLPVVRQNNNSLVIMASVSKTIFSAHNVAAGGDRGTGIKSKASDALFTVDMRSGQLIRVSAAEARQHGPRGGLDHSVSGGNGGVLLVPTSELDMDVAGVERAPSPEEMRFMLTECDFARMRQVLMNLVSNSTKFSNNSTIGIRMLITHDLPAEMTGGRSANVLSGWEEVKDVLTLEAYTDKDRAKEEAKGRTSSKGGKKKGKTKGVHSFYCGFLDIVGILASQGRDARGNATTARRIETDSDSVPVVDPDTGDSSDSHSSFHDSDMEVSNSSTGDASGASESSASAKKRLTRVRDKPLPEVEEWLVVEVSDAGIGMTREQLGVVFESFRQADASTTRRFGGSGLGLALVKSFAHALGGSVSVRSQSGRGTVFTVCVPRYPLSDVRPAPLAATGGSHASEVSDSSQSTASASASSASTSNKKKTKKTKKTKKQLATESESESSSDDDDDLQSLDSLGGSSVGDDDKTKHNGKRGGKRSGKGHELVVMDDDGSDLDTAESVDVTTVLLVDDDQAVHDVLGKSLSRQGYNVVHARDGQEGLQMVRQTMPDLVLSDVMMPRLDGLGMLARMRADKAIAHIPVVMMSMSDSKTTAFSMGAVDFMSKPLNARSILDRLDVWRRTALQDATIEARLEASKLATHNSLAVQAARAGAESQEGVGGGGSGSSSTMVDDVMAATGFDGALPGMWVLVVDDTADIRTLLHRHMTRAGYHCEVAVNGKKALRVLETAMRASEKEGSTEPARGPPLVILLDLQMPTMDGFEFLRRLRTHRRSELQSCRVVVMTAKNITEADERFFVEHNVDERVPKLAKGVNSIESIVAALRNAHSNLE